MAISTEEITKVVDSTFATVDEFGAMMKLLAGVGARVKLEVQLGETYRKIQSVQTELQARQQARQTENVADSQETQKVTDDLQALAAQLQTQIDAINAQLPDLLG